MAFSTTRRPRLVDDVAPTLDSLARATAGGTSLLHALGELPAHSARPFATLLRSRLDEYYWGTPLAQSLDARASDSHPEVLLALTTLSLLARHGGSCAAALDRTASAVRERRHAVAERHAQAAQARLSSAMLSVLPVLFAAWCATTDPRVSAFIVHAPAGWVCVGCGAALNACGWIWMRRIIGGRP